MLCFSLSGRSFGSPLQFNCITLCTGWLGSNLTTGNPSRQVLNGPYHWIAIENGSLQFFPRNAVYTQLTCAQQTAPGPSLLRLLTLPHHFPRSSLDLTVQLPTQYATVQH